MTYNVFGGTLSLTQSIWTIMSGVSCWKITINSSQPTTTDELKAALQVLAATKTH